MHLIGRYERVRPWHPATDHWDPPFILDRKWATMAPFACDEWHRLKSGVWISTTRAAMAALKDQRGTLSFPSNGPQFRLPMQLGGSGGNSGATLALDSAYVFNVSGDGAAIRYVGQGKSVANLYYFISAAATGTQANINDIEAELRNSNSGATLPSTTLHSSGSANPNGEGTWIGWHKIALSAFTGVLGTLYWGIVGDTDGNGTDFATIQYAFGSGDHLLFDAVFLQPYFNAAGFSSAATTTTRWPNIIIEYTDGTTQGWSTTTHNTVSSTTNRRGLRHPGFTEQIKVWAAVIGTGGFSSGPTGIEIYNDDGTVPGGTTQASGTVLLQSGANIIGALLSAAYTVPKAVPQRIVFTYGGVSTTAPRKLAIGTTNGYATALRAARMGGAGYYYAEANGTTNWANDDQDAQPDLALIFEDVVAQAAGGGAHGGLRPLGMRRI
jgi:hypothetical protein